MGSFLEGLMYRGKFAFRNRLGSLLPGRKFTIFLCFSLYLRAISKYKLPRGGGGDLTEGFCYVTSLGGLYLEGLIFGILRYSSSVGRYLKP